MALKTHHRIRRRYRFERLLVMAAMVTFGFLAIVCFAKLSPASGRGDPGCFANNGGSAAGAAAAAAGGRRLLQTPDNGATDENRTMGPIETGSLYPTDLFTIDQLRSGAVILHIIGMIYMFVALAIICDEFFVPSLVVLIQILHMSEDVAGATFMAAGGSAPELFTSIIGVFIAHSDVGIGTIVGSAVFNILFVIGMCAMFSVTVLTLTWWPLFRDVTFYSVSLCCLIAFFLDQLIYWWEALILLLVYASYVIFMKFNHQVEYWVKSKITCNRVGASSAPTQSTDNLMDNHENREHSKNVLKSGSCKFRHGVLQLMIHTIDPLGEAKIHDKALKLHAVASLKDNNSNPMENHNRTSRHKGNAEPLSSSIPAISNGVINPTISGSSDNLTQQPTTLTSVTADGDAGGQPSAQNSPRTSAGPNNDSNQATAASGDKQANRNQATDGKKNDAIEEENEPLDISWPLTARKRFTYILVAPIIFPLWATLPDVRRYDRRKFFPWTFTGSILWIAVFSYLMNWWASTAGVVIGIPDAVMGLTFLAAGTSIPDLITSVIVAKKGFGDMAVSSSVGSNIFDVTVGLPLPWLMYGAIYGAPYQVDSRGLFCSIVLLFLMLMFVIISIAIFKWKMNKALGATMFVMYVLFVSASLLLEYDIFLCPIG